MKSKFRMLACLLPLAIGFSASASAAVTVDQVNLVNPAQGTLVGSSIRTFAGNNAGRYGQLQSVTAGRTGTLARIDLQLTVSPQQSRDVAFKVELFSGEPGDTGPLNAAAFKSFTLADVPTAAQAQQGAVFSANLLDLGFSVAAGAKFSYAVTIADELVNRQGPTVVLGYLSSDLDEFGAPIIVGLDYQGGFNTLLNSDGARLVSGLDRGFRTWVDVTAVPEPVSWALMVLGFGTAGAAVRRRRARPALA